MTLRQDQGRMKPFQGTRCLRPWPNEVQGRVCSTPRCPQLGRFTWPCSEKDKHEHMKTENPTYSEASTFANSHCKSWYLHMVVFADKALTNLKKKVYTYPLATVEASTKTSKGQGRAIGEQHAAMKEHLHNWQRTFFPSNPWWIFHHSCATFQGKLLTGKKKCRHPQFMYQEIIALFFSPPWSLRCGRGWAPWIQTRWTLWRPTHWKTYGSDRVVTIANLNEHIDIYFEGTHILTYM